MDNLILIVDDAVFARNLIKKCLNSANYTHILEATTAKDAISKFTAFNPELVLLDITLPDRKDLSLLEDLLKINPDAKIVMNSAIGQDLIIADALKMGAKDFIVKPFEEKQLLNIVKNLLQNN
ncbi:MAG: response regulator [Clostridiales bacterium]|nr:response regulator [Clostridiales bacterium]